MALGVFPLPGVTPGVWADLVLLQVVVDDLGVLEDGAVSVLGRVESFCQRYSGPLGGPGSGRRVNSLVDLLQEAAIFFL